MEIKQLPASCQNYSFYWLELKSVSLYVKTLKNISRCSDCDNCVVISDDQC